MTATVHEAAAARAHEVLAARYRATTTRSAALTARARGVLPGGSTRTVGWFAPYPMVFARGSGAYLTDVDGRRYVDMFGNGLSLIHGHAYPPVVEVTERVVRSGTAWPGTSEPQIEFAELLSARLRAHGMVRFTNTGTEAAMLAVKLARHVTGRPAVLKTWAGYHGSYDDLEAGLHGKGELPGRTYLADFNDIGSVERAFAAHGAEIAAVILESVMYTGVVTVASRAFLAAVRELTRRHGALLILDDCLMFRLAEGGSAQVYDLAPDLTVLGKFIGGGTPVGAVVGDPGVVGSLDPGRVARLYHGGSFNGNVLGTACGIVTVQALTADVIAAMDARAAAIRSALHAAASRLGLPLTTSGSGSAFGVYLADTLPAPRSRVAEPTSRLFHLAAVNRGVLIGDGNELALSSAVDDRVTGEVIERLTAALADVAGALDRN